MCSDLVIDARCLRKDYFVFEKPSHRLWQMLVRKAHTFYRTHSVLQGVSFQVRRGETVGIVGRNGCGKSTLLGIICGTLPATGGSVQVKGRVAALLELGAGFDPELDGRDNIELCAQLYGLTAEQIEARLPDIIAFADIGDYIDQPVKTYSSGMFTRLAFSVVAHVDADILVVDEALAVGDAYFVQKCMRFLERFKAGGGTLLFVSHDMGAVSSLCDRAIWLRDGLIAMDAPPGDVAGGYLADLYNAVQGSADAPVAGGDTGAPAKDDPVDIRAELVRSSPLRNDIEVFEFKAGHDFGAGGATIESVALRDRSGRRLAWVVGGELVRMEIEARAATGLSSPIVGFVVKDRLGQPLFGDNTYLQYVDQPLELGAGERVRASFEFRMPVLARGTYSVSVAVAEGHQADHVVHQWVHEALVLDSHSTSLSTGLIGIPMHGIVLQRLEGGGRPQHAVGEVHS